MTEEVFAPLRLARRVWAVAAIHGESERLKRLHSALFPRFEPGDRLVYLGNFMGRGPDVAGTMTELLDFRRDLLAAMPGIEAGDIVYLRGAQEEMWRKLLELQFAPNPGEVLTWMLNEGVGPTLAAYGADVSQGPAICRSGTLAIVRWTTGLREMLRRAAGHDELLASLRRAALTDGGELLFVSAGIDPSRPLGEQGDTFWWGSGYMSNVTEPYAGFRLVVRGYDRARQPASVGHVVASLDGGAGFGGTLNAGCFSLDGLPVDWIEA